MAIDSSLRLALVEAFDELHRMLNRPALYAIPWQTPAGASYDADVDAWVDGDGDVVTKTPAELTYHTIPALWGADTNGFIMALGGLSAGGDLVAIAKAAYRNQIEGSMMVVTGSLSGEKYNITNLENAPDGGAAIFVVVELQRREG